MSIFLIIELSSIILFTIYLIHAYRRDALLGRLLNLKFLFLALIYAFIFEDISITLSAGLEGGYFYNENFLFFLHQTPLFIVLLWSIILYSSYNIIKKISSGKQAIFLTSLYVLNLDIILDLVAVRLNLWTWLGMEGQLGFYSVPAANYLGWLLLPFAFLVIWEKLKTVEMPWQGVFTIFQPFLAFILFLIITFPLYGIKSLFFEANFLGQYLLAAPVFLLFVYLVFHFKDNFRNNSSHFDLSLFIIRLFVHIFSLLGIIWLDLYNNLLILLVFSLVLFFEYIIFRLVKKAKI